MSHIIPPHMVIFPFNMDIYLYVYLFIWVHVCMGTCLYVHMCVWVLSLCLFVPMSSYVYGYLCVWGTCLYGYSSQQLVSQMWSFHFRKQLINVYHTQMSKLS